MDSVYGSAEGKLPYSRSCFNNDHTSEMEYSSFDGGVDGEHNGVGVCLDV